MRRTCINAQVLSSILDAKINLLLVFLLIVTKISFDEKHINNLSMIMRDRTMLHQFKSSHKQKTAMAGLCGESG